MIIDGIKFMAEFMFKAFIPGFIAIMAVGMLLDFIGIGDNSDAENYEVNAPSMCAAGRGC